MSTFSVQAMDFTFPNSGCETRLARGMENPKLNKMIEFVKNPTFNIPHHKTLYIYLK